MTSAIQDYWNSRAATLPHSPAATTNDIHLRELEIRTLNRLIAGMNLKPGSRVLDAGCGDGYTTLTLAVALKDLHFTGIDYAAAMIDSAAERLIAHPDLKYRVQFGIGDVTAIDHASVPEPFDVAITCRCLINLPDDNAQREAFSQIAACLKPGGVFLAIENFHEGQNAMNRAREAVDLPPIPIRWHNRYFTEAQFQEMAGQYFTVTRFDDSASGYYFATRVIYSKMCQVRGEEPDYDHDIHRLAVHLPSYGGYSPVRLAILQPRKERP